MSTPNSLYSNPSREIYLLENVEIQGRKTELRQLLKLLNLAKTGQPKAALVTGDSGIGKSALVDTLVKLVRDGVYCRILDLGKMRYNSPEALYVALVDQLQAEANDILDEALIAVNEITYELDLGWDRQDLVRAIALVKLQESIGGKDAVSQEQLVKAIRSQVPAIKKLSFSVNDSIEKLVDLIVNPWVMVATSLLNPMSPALQEAIRLADTLRDGLPPPPPPEASGIGAYTTTSVTARPGDQPEALPLNASQSIIHLEALDDLHPTSVPMIDDLESALPSPVSRSSSGTALSTTIRVESGSARGPQDPLVVHLMTLFNFINNTIQNLDSGLLIVLDEWDRTLEQPEQARLKSFLSELLTQLTEQKNNHFMTVMTARSEGESHSLGGKLYNLFRTKLLLEPLNENACRKLVRHVLLQAGVEVEEAVNQQIYRLSRGNPFWHLKILHYLRERVESNRLKHVDLEFFNRLGITDLDSLAELSFTRLKLAFLNDEESLYKVIAALLKTFGERPFTSSQAIREISTSQGFTDGYVFEVLRALFRHDFIQEVPISASELAEPAPLPDEPKRLTDKSRRPDEPSYTVHSRYILAFLQDKTRAIQTDISTDEKLMYLKKIIPLSVKSGELDREKTMEVLALSDAMNKPEIVTFLEDIFLEHLRDDKPVVRVTALNNLALIDSQRARDALFKVMRDEDSMVREYAARNLALLSQKSSGDSALADRIVEVMLQSIDDESEAVRAQVYAAISKYKWHQDMVNVFIKGLSDACDSVRLTSAQNLVNIDSDSPFVFTSLLDALNDPVADIRRYACMGLQRFPQPEAIQAIVRTLQTDEDSAIRALAADSLSRMENPKAFQAMLNALRNESSEDVKLAVVRALGKRRGWQTEEILLESIQTADVERMPVFVWACIRSLGQVGGTERSQRVLLELQRHVSNPIILSAIELATNKIQERMDALRHMERQLEEATPVTVAIPTEYDEEVAVPEEEPAMLHTGAEDGTPRQAGEEDLLEEQPLMPEAELAQLARPAELPFKR